MHFTSVSGWYIQKFEARMGMHPQLGVADKMNDILYCGEFRIQNDWATGCL